MLTFSCKRLIHSTFKLESTHEKIVIAINKLDKHHFLYNAQLTLFDNEEFIEQAKKSLNFEEFKNTIYSYL